MDDPLLWHPRKPFAQAYVTSAQAKRRVGSPPQLVSRQPAHNYRMIDAMNIQLENYFPVFLVGK